MQGPHRHRVLMDDECEQMWRVRLCLAGGGREHVGYYANEEEGAHAYNVALQKKESQAGAGVRPAIQTAELPAARKRPATSQATHGPQAMLGRSPAGCEALREGVCSANGAFSHVGPHVAHLPLTHVSSSPSLHLPGTRSLPGSPAASVAASAMLHAHSNSSQMTGSSGLDTLALFHGLGSRGVVHVPVGSMATILL